MQHARVWWATTLAALAVPAAAQAAVRTGERTDPANDATYAADIWTGHTAQLLDIRKVLARHDSVAGRLTLAFEGRDLVNMTHSGMSLEAVLSAVNPEGLCDSVQRPGGFRVVASVGSGYDQTEPAHLEDLEGNRLAEGTIAFPGTGSRPEITLTSARLTGTELRCVSSVWGTRGDSSYQTSSTDWLDGSFCLGDCPVPAPADFKASGTRLSWSPVAGASSYKVAISTRPEGSAGRTTTYKTITGTAHTPPRAVGASRWYGVRANLTGGRWASPEVRITYP